MKSPPDRRSIKINFYVIRTKLLLLLMLFQSPLTSKEGNFMSWQK